MVFTKDDLTSDNGILTIDLGKIKQVTGIGIQQLQSEKLEDFSVEVSVDKTFWTTLKEGRKHLGTWEITVSCFNAGIELPGANVRFIRISSKAETSTKIQFRNLAVYGFK